MVHTVQPAAFCIYISLTRLDSRHGFAFEARRVSVPPLPRDDSSSLVRRDTATTRTFGRVLFCHDILRLRTSSLHSPDRSRLWEKHEGFRETLLLNFTDRRANQTLRRLGLFLLDLALECPPSWPNHPEGSTRSELRAALADLRHLQGFLSSVGREHILSSLGFEDTALSQFAVRQAREVETIANRIEDELEQWAAKAQ